MGDAFSLSFILSCSYLFSGIPQINVAAYKNKINNPVLLWTNIYLRVFLRTHAKKPVSHPKTKIICKQTLLISLFILYKLRNTCKELLTGDQNTQYRMRQTFCLKCELGARYNKISHAMRSASAVNTLHELCSSVDWYQLKIVTVFETILSASS